jgi:hypothetical protein
MEQQGEENLQPRPKTLTDANKEFADKEVQCK